ncbi:MAG: ParB/RepB/Spo0J family partition protein [Ruminococcus sp.]|nr:ParB/RepB/Spo0J family partition protein [Ruminococcus sp.]
MAKGGLGAGLDLLFSDNSNNVQIKSTLRISEIEPNRDQPRKYFSEEGITALADSIREHGILQPILVRPLSDGTGNYQIVAGERRWRAARRLGLSEVPVIIKEFSDIETMQIAVIENLQRENLNPVEEALSYNDLIEKYGMTQEKVAKMTGKSRSAIANSIRLLSLPNQVLEMLASGSLSSGQAKALLAFEDEETLLSVAEKAVDGGITVRQIEKLTQKENVPRGTKFNKSIDNYFIEMEISLKERLGRKVKVDYGKSKGVLVLEFYDKEDLKAIAEKLANE